MCLEQKQESMKFCIGKLSMLKWYAHAFVKITPRLISRRQILSTVFCDTASLATALVIGQRNGFMPLAFVAKYCGFDTQTLK